MLPSFTNLSIDAPKRGGYREDRQDPLLPPAKRHTLFVSLNEYIRSIWSAIRTAYEQHSNVTFEKTVRIHAIDWRFTLSLEIHPSPSGIPTAQLQILLNGETYETYSLSLNSAETFDALLQTITTMIEDYDPWHHSQFGARRET